MLLPESREPKIPKKAGTLFFCPIPEIHPKMLLCKGWRFYCENEEEYVNILENLYSLSVQCKPDESYTAQPFSIRKFTLKSSIDTNLLRFHALIGYDVVFIIYQRI